MCEHETYGYCKIGCKSEDIKPGRACIHDKHCACHSEGATVALANIVSKIIKKKGEENAKE